MGSEPGRYRGLLIDWGGVLTTDVFESFSAFCEQEGLEPDEIRRRFREDRASRELLIGLENGSLPEPEFETELATILGVSPSGLIERLFAGSQVEDSMLEAVLRVRQSGIRTGLISNSWGTSRYDRARLAELFDGVVLSGEVGMRKPTPEIYTLGAERIDVPAEACVFVDDLPFNLKPAAELGMATVRHVSPDQTLSELERLLGLRLR